MNPFLVTVKTRLKDIYIPIWSGHFHWKRIALIASNSRGYLLASGVSLYLLLDFVRFYWCKNYKKNNQSPVNRKSNSLTWRIYIATSRKIKLNIRFLFFTVSQNKIGSQTGQCNSDLVSKSVKYWLKVMIRTKKDSKTLFQ